MKSLKVKLTVIILIMVIISSMSTLIIGLNKSFNMTKNIIQTQTTSELSSASNMLSTYLESQLGSLDLNSDGNLCDQNGKPIEGNYEAIDKFCTDMNVVATVFEKQGDNFIRIITTIKDDTGARAVGTALDSAGKAYAEIAKGNSYIGKNEILGVQYMTQYVPMYNADHQEIGLYFVGVPMSAVNAIYDNGTSATIRTLAIIIALLLLVAAAVTIFLSGTIVNPIKKVTDVAQRIADGNFDVSLSINSKDEVGQLAGAFNLTIEKLINYQGYIDEISDTLHNLSLGNLRVKLTREYTGQFKKLKDNMLNLLSNLNTTMIQINQSMIQVDSGSAQVSNGAQSLAQGATEQASAIEELSASIADVSQQIKLNADNAKSALDKSAYAGEELSNSATQMQDMISAMQKITAKSSEISKIIKIIDDIAFQTNILALNAAVEAARAGAAGKGFAVVADEVRNLAGKSAEAAKNTAVLIEETIKAVDAGSNIADRTSGSLAKTSAVTNEAVVLIDRIAQATEDQAVSISQINQGVEQISSVVQTNAATAEESAAASEELSEQANILKQLINKFELADVSSAKS
ncbi:MAG: methyl-accepting chemotaxis protein [Firmicutes bacterium HGW-Firmicutes-16]|nr:MAG: methyl-accepting chemotaxis protein [Firmicutes bacterium HGW-Firmicutes-16]